MLVLTRKVNETVIVDGDIEIRILLVRGGRVRIGIQAPADVRIARGELIDSASSRPTGKTVPDAA